MIIRVILAVIFSALASAASSPAISQHVTPETVIDHYGDIAEAKYADSLFTAETLHTKIKEFLARPSDSGIRSARDAWRAARVPYQQTEVYRFGNAIVDDWEGRVNAWPLDEGLIDYVDGSYGNENYQNSLYTANVIANPELLISGKIVDSSTITPEFLSTILHEAGGIEANVAIGYHAIEFLLWGQDLNGNDSAGGNRAWTDFSIENCTNGNCDRRRDYLAAATALLVSDLKEMAENWKDGGIARVELSAKGAKGGLGTILTGMGSLSYGELAGERMKLGLLLGDQEEEHDCFSDNTHNAHFYNALGIRNVYLGVYTRIDGTKMTGPSLSDLVAGQDTVQDEELKAKLDVTIAAMEAVVTHAEETEAYDRMIAVGNDKGNAVVNAAINALVDQTRAIERVISTLSLGSIELEGSNSLDSPNAVFR